ncbi:ANTAR domain-containing protein [Streptomyces sp. NPDC047071]|uniref:ANTAR domain-containing protein n=1 Tax=Streptomyces sp. NPDC047071 TaxID=3154808 RepID=UPI003455E999
MLATAAHAPAPVADQVRELQEQVEQLKQAVRSHAVIDQAIGVVLTVGQLTPQEAWDVLREMSMRSNTKLRTVADHLLAWAQTGDLPAPLRAELARQLTLRDADGATVSRTARQPGRTRGTHATGPSSTARGEFSRVLPGARGRNGPRRTDRRRPVAGPVQTHRHQRSLPAPTRHGTARHRIHAERSPHPASRETRDGEDPFPGKPTERRAALMHPACPHPAARPAARAAPLPADSRHARGVPCGPAGRPAAGHAGFVSEVRLRLE